MVGIEDIHDDTDTNIFTEKIVFGSNMEGVTRKYVGMQGELAIILKSPKMLRVVADAKLQQLVHFDVRGYEITLTKRSVKIGSSFIPKERVQDVIRIEVVQ